MKDFRFTKGTVDVTFRTDGIYGDNFTVYEIYGLNDRRPSDEPYDNDEIALMEEFKKMPHNITDFKTFATNNSMGLTMADSDGSNLETLV